jgi:hypothetical protein
VAFVTLVRPTSAVIGEVISMQPRSTFAVSRLASAFSTAPPFYYIILAAADPNLAGLAGVAGLHWTIETSIASPSRHATGSSPWPGRGDICAI